MAQRGADAEHQAPDVAGVAHDSVRALGDERVVLAHRERPGEEPAQRAVAQQAQAAAEAQQRAACEPRRRGADMDCLGRVAREDAEDGGRGGGREVG